MSTDSNLLVSRNKLSTVRVMKGAFAGWFQLLGRWDARLSVSLRSEENHLVPRGILKVTLIMNSYVLTGE